MRKCNKVLFSVVCPVIWPCISHFLSIINYVLHIIHVLTTVAAGGAICGACASGLVSRKDDVSLARLLSPFTDDASLAKLTVSDTKGESLSDEVSEAVVGSESV